MNRIEDANLYSAEDVANIKAIVECALSGPIEFKRLNGCGRVYLHFGYKNLKKSSKLAKVLHGVGPCKAFARPGYKGVVFYMGYDNAHGRIFSEAEAIEKALRDAGYLAYTDVDGD